MEHVAFGISPVLLLSRLAGLSTCLPSLITNVNIFNCVWQRNKGRRVQTAILIYAVVAGIIDIAFLACHVTWFYTSGTWPSWGVATVVLQLLKRLNSAVVVFLVFLRSTVLVPSLHDLHSYRHAYLVVYLAIGCTSVICHVYSYAQAGWVSSLAYEHMAYRMHRIMDALAVAYYTVPALLTDLSFMAMAKANPQIASRFSVLKPFFNTSVYFGFEMVMTLAVLVPLFLGVTDTLFGSAAYNEAFLLALVCQNSSYSVRAAAPGVTTRSKSTAAGQVTGAPASVTIITIAGKEFVSEIEG
ncbi:hypothetical protein H9P43_000406 [Blastocladiella emersonii ATCC 22665]|nr:hypothetical protein H9P43_000406 [Blastocladiella emersonii ATCC 22665]